MLIRRAKIVATIGPACQDKDTLEKIVQSGVDVARLNFSHGEHKDHKRVIDTIREVSQNLQKPITILQDLQGPKIRIGEITRGVINLAPEQVLNLTTQDTVGDEKTISVNFPDLTKVVKPGSRILIDDGNIELSVNRVNHEQVETRVVIGGELRSKKGVNLPGVHLDLTGFTNKDEADLAFGLIQGVDAVAISFVRTVNDIHTVREAIHRLAPERKNVPIIAKIERPEALDNLESIMDIADGVMVARGDLGVEMSPEAVPIAQKRILETANRHGKVSITATQMLDSMIHNPRPTRAESTDVANAIFDGTDAVMLSGETAAGKYPVLSVKTMNDIVCEAEEHMQEWGHWNHPSPPRLHDDDAYYVTQAARELAHDKNVAAIAVFTKSGRTAQLMSKSRPGVCILAFTSNTDVYFRLNLLWGVQPYLVPHIQSIEEMLKVVESKMVESTPIQAGNQVVLICGFPVNSPRPTNLALLHTVG